MELIPKIKKAFRTNLLPGIVLWIFGTSLILGYYYLSPVQIFLDRMASLKDAYGFLFSFVSMGLFAGFIPAFVATIIGHIPKHRRFQDIIFYTIFWSYKGMEIDLLYRIQVVLFGEGSDFLTLTYKTIVDQFVYMPLIATIPLLILYRWKDLDYKTHKVVGQLKTKAFWAQVPLVVISCWIVWIPAVYMIYWFPPSLQLAIANLIECFWALMLIVLTGSNTDN